MSFKKETRNWLKFQDSKNSNKHKHKKYLHLSSKKSMLSSKNSSLNYNTSLTSKPPKSKKWYKPSTKKSPSSKPVTIKTPTDCSNCHKKKTSTWNKLKISPTSANKCGSAYRGWVRKVMSLKKTYKMGSKCKN